jgi:NADH:ubiquinone oxidoreductase subunit F (NADH-binding)/NADH:ubiquinone oxidoreductase subunit E
VTAHPDDPSATALDGVLARFPRERTWLLPALHAVQDILGHLPAFALVRTGDHLRVPASEVYGVATHYPEFRLRPRGAHLVRVCTGVSCALLGGGDLLAAAAKRCAVKPEWAGAPSEITLETADCFFECGIAPVIEVDGEYRGRVGLDEIADLERWFRPPALAARSAPGASSRPAPAVAAASRSARGLASVPAEQYLAELIQQASARRQRRPDLRLVVQTGTCGRAVGGAELLEALREAVRTRGLAADVIDGACNGMCYAAPLVEVQRPGWPRVVLERAAAADVGRLLDQLVTPDGDLARVGLAGIAWAERRWRGLTPVGEHPFWRAQERVLTARTGTIDPNDLDDALVHGAYGALARALDGTPESVIDRVKASGLQGRGGAFFPTGVKWATCRSAPGEPKYVVMNGEEGEPGIFKDRHLMEGDPHQVLEGVLLAAYAAGATRAILYVHGEAHLSAERLARALDQASAAGITGERILGRAFCCHVELRRGAGGFVLGEETALLESIEGRRALPRTRPPFPAESGLWGRPTVVNNAETLAAIPSIVLQGGAWFAALGTPAAPGTKVFGLSGPLQRPGVVEVRNGMTLGDLLDGIGGGSRDGRPFQGAVVGGPSGSIVPATLFGVPMEPRGQVSPGTGGVVAVPEGASVVEIVTALLRFNADESCGKCTPCREGTPRLLAMIGGLGSSAEPRARELAETIQLASLCGLGQAAPLALLRALETFPGAFHR